MGHAERPGCGWCRLAARGRPCQPAQVEITLVKRRTDGDDDRAYLTVDGQTRHGPIHVVHDLPHLVVESLFEISDGLWGELAAGRLRVIT